MSSRAEHNQNPPTDTANRHCALISTRQKKRRIARSPPGTAGFSCRSVARLVGNAAGVSAAGMQFGHSRLDIDFLPVAEASLGLDFGTSPCEVASGGGSGHSYVSVSVYLPLPPPAPRSLTKEEQQRSRSHREANKGSGAAAFCIFWLLNSHFYAKPVCFAF